MTFRDTTVPKRDKRLIPGILLSLALALSFSAATASAQSSIAGTVTGQVKDESGGAVPGVAVKLIELATGTSFSTVSNDAGLYDFPTVPPGKYDVNFSKSAWEPYFKSFTRNTPHFLLDSERRSQYNSSNRHLVE